MESRSDNVGSKMDGPRRVQSVNTDSKYIKEKSLLVVRMKPIGQGETDQFKKNTAVNQYQNKEYVGSSYEDHAVMFCDLARKNNIHKYNYPDIVATDDFDNKRMYDETVAQKIPHILDGYSMVIVAYGQTGSGKTHTMIGKLGVFKNPPSDNLDNLDDNLGLFPRAALDIFQGLKQKSQKTLMTITLCESNAVHPIDLVTKGPIWLDPTTNELLGGKEHLIENYDDIFKLGALFESERSVGATKFNFVSSRSHAMIWIRIYTVVDQDKIRINHVKILDLAGSERVSQLQDDDPNKMVSIGINWTLTMLSQVISQMAELKKPVIDGNEIPKHIRWKEFFITRVMKEAFNGLALTQFIFCAKQHDHNSGETFATIIFAERFQKLKGQVCRPKPVSISKMIQLIEGRIANNISKNQQMSSSKRQNKSSAQDRVELNKIFIDADTYTLKLLNLLI